MTTIRVSGRSSIMSSTLDQALCGGAPMGHMAADIGYWGGLKRIDAIAPPVRKGLGMLSGNFRIDSNNDLIGWAIDKADHARVVVLRLVVDGRDEGKLRADLFRPDLAAVAQRTDAGFLMRIGRLIAGSRTVEIRLVDDLTGEVLPPGTVTHMPLSASVGATFGGGGLAIVETFHGPMILNRKDLGVDLELLRYGEYAVSEVRIIERFIRSGAAAIDIGANIGALTLAMAASAKGGELVYAFEPQPNVFLRLCGNLALNGCESVRPINAAISDVAGTVVIAPIDYSQSHVSGGVRVQQEGPGRRITCHRLDDMEFEGRPIGFIKIDVEGHELSVFRGGLGLIERDKPAVYFEIRDRDACREVFGRLIHLGYHVFWHAAPLFRPDNFFHNSVDHYHGSGINSNVLAVPEPVPDFADFGLVPLASVDEFWPVERFPAQWADKIGYWRSGAAA